MSRKRPDAPNLIVRGPFVREAAAPPPDDATSVTPDETYAPRGPELPRTDFYVRDGWSRPARYVGSMVLNEQGIAVATTEEVEVWIDMVVMGRKTRGGPAERVVPADGVHYLVGQEWSHGHCLVHGCVFHPGPEGHPWDNAAA